jgi:hypothetical protein
VPAIGTPWSGDVAKLLKRNDRIATSPSAGMLTVRHVQRADGSVDVYLGCVYIELQLAKPLTRKWR